MVRALIYNVTFRAMLVFSCAVSTLRLQRKISLTQRYTLLFKLRQAEHAICPHVVELASATPGSPQRYCKEQTATKQRRGAHLADSIIARRNPLVYG